MIYKITYESYYGKIIKTLSFVLCYSVSVNSPETALYETSYVTVHKAPCRVAVFHKNGTNVQCCCCIVLMCELNIVLFFKVVLAHSNEQLKLLRVIGQLIATGSEDTSIKV